MKLSSGKALLRESGIENYSAEAERIFCHFAKVTKAECKLSDPESDLPCLIEAFSQRAKRVPLPYILGGEYFYREYYELNGDCLVPRADTETLVETAISLIKGGENILDLCTGCGCVGISVLKNSQAAEATLLDISEGAIVAARKNAVLNGVGENVKCVLADAVNYIPEEKFFAILSNPPYVDDKVYESLEKEIFFEPKRAFVGGDGGLDFYKALIPRYKSYLKEGGFMAMEIGYDQRDALIKIGESEGFFVKIIKDLSGNDRVALLTRIQG